MKTSMRFDLVDLRLFLFVVEAANITHGAARVGMALASASERIRLMEESLGAPLSNGTAVAFAQRKLAPPSSITLNWSFSSWNGCVANCQRMRTASVGASCV